MGKRRRRSSRDSFWMQQYGGMPVWGLAAALIVVLALGTWVAVSLPTQPTIASDRQPRPVAPLSTGVAAEPEETEAALPPLEVERPDGTALRVLFAGDSLTGSYFASTIAKGFRPLLVSEWDADGEVDPVGVGVPHGRLSAVEDGTEIPEDAQLAVIEIGTNDFGKTPVDEFRDQYDALLARVADASPGVTFVCTGLWQRPGMVVGGLAEALYDDEIKAACEAVGGRYVDLNGIYMTSGSRGPAGVETETGESDEFHPNDRGHRLIADAILAAVTVR